MRHFATLALAALLLAPAAFAQDALTQGPRFDQVSTSTDDASAALVAITQNASLEVTGGTVACASTDQSTGAPLGTTLNSFWRTFDLSDYTIPGNAQLTSVDFGVSITFDQATTAGATLSVYTLPAGTNTANGFSLSQLTELVSQDFSYSAVGGNVRTLDSAIFETAPRLNGDEILAVGIAFEDGVPDVEETGRQFDARAGGNEAGADGPTFLSVDPDCGGAAANPVPFSALGNFPLDWVVVLNVDEAGAVSSIGDARSAGAGNTVTIEGIVTRTEGAFTYLQDETGGLTIRQTSGAFFEAVAAGTIQPGTVIQITGELSEFNGLLQINGSALESFETFGEVAVPAAQMVTLAELAANGEAYEGELVRVPNVTLTTTDTQFQAATTYDITDDFDATNAVSLRIPNAGDSELDGTAIPGNPISITGPVGQFSSTDPAAGYQIFGIASGDITGGATAIGEDPEGRLSLGGLLPNPSAEEATVTVSLASAGRATLVVYDVLGREVARLLDRDLVAGDLVVRVDVSTFEAGTYLARLTANGGTAVRPFTVVR